MDPTLVLVLRLLLFAFAAAGALELGRRMLRRSRPRVTPTGTSPLRFYRSAARIMSLAGILGIVVGVATRGPTEAVVTAMGIAAAGFVLFVILTAVSWIQDRGS